MVENRQFEQQEYKEAIVDDWQDFTQNNEERRTMFMHHGSGGGYGPQDEVDEPARWSPYPMRPRVGYSGQDFSQDYFSGPEAMTLTNALRSPWSAADHNSHIRHELTRSHFTQQNNFTEALGTTPNRRGHLRIGASEGV